MLQSVCTDVEIEPQLQKVENAESYHRTAIVSDEARLDVRARGFWRQKQILNKHEQEKKRNYNRRVIEEEHGTFTPLILTTTGVMGHECSQFHKALAEKISNKKGEKYEDVIRYIRLRLSFLVVRATLLCLRGSRASHSKYEVSEDYGLRLSELGV